MAKVVKMLCCAAMIAAILMSPGLDAAPHNASSTKRDLSPAAANGTGDLESKTIHELVSNIRVEAPITHIDDLQKPGFEIAVHDYPPPPPPTEFESIALDILHYLEQTFHFIDVVDKNDLLSTDIVDESWYGWFQYLQQIWPFINYETVHANNVKNPNDNPPSIWHQLLHLMLARQKVHQVDKQDINNDGHKETDINLTYTTINFDPIGQFFRFCWNFFSEYSGFNTLSEWWTRFQTEWHKASNYQYVKTDREDIATEPLHGGGGGGGGGAIHYPEGVLHISRYDPVVLGVNTLLFIGYNALFWAVYAPISGVENLGADYPDYYDDEDYPDEEGDEDNPDEEGDEEEGDEEEGDEEEGDGDDPDEEGDGDNPDEGDGDYPDQQGDEGDYPDYQGDGGDYPDYQGGGDYSDGQGGGGDYPDNGGGGGGDGNRRDYYYYYNNFNDYNYYDRADRGGGGGGGGVVRGGGLGGRRGGGRRGGGGGGGATRTHVGDAKKDDSLSSNYYSHGAIPPHEAYTLFDTNIFVKK